MDKHESDDNLPARLDDDSRRRLERIRWLSWLFDESIVLPGGYRVGIDGLLGIAAGAGDGISALFSLYIVYEAARLGAPLSMICKMLLRIGIDMLVGAIPILGDLFDFAYKANARNVATIEEYLAMQHPVNEASAKQHPGDVIDVTPRRID